MSRHYLRARTGEDRTSLYDEITNKIIAELEAGRVPWVQPWGTAAAKASLAMPKSAATGRQYSGINVLILWGPPSNADSQARAGLPSAKRCRSAVTSARASAARPSSMPTALCHSTKSVARRETGEEAQAIPFLKRFTVFNTRSVRQLALGDRNDTAASAARPDRAKG